MKHILTVFASYVATFLLFWLAGGFIALDWNLLEWSPWGRYFLVTLGLAGPLFAWAGNQ